jgi:hypothetical protein
MKDLLPGSLADIRAEIESGNARVERFYLLAALQGNRVDGFALFNACLENVGGVPSGDDERMERLDWELVPDGKRQCIFRD